MKMKGAGNGRSPTVRVGSLVLAKYEDGEIYRAKVEQMSDDEKSVRVRYIDYGNCGLLESSDLFTWEPMLNLLPAQAVSCRLQDLKPEWIKQENFSQEQKKEFVAVMKNSGKLKMNVIKRLRTPNFLLDTEEDSSAGPELEVSVHEAEAGADLTCRMTSLHCCFIRLLSQSQPCPPKEEVGVDYAVPEPLHLQAEPLPEGVLDKCPDSPSLPGPEQIGRSCGKVAGWLSEDQPNKNIDRQKVRSAGVEADLADAVQIKSVKPKMKAKAKTNKSSSAVFPSVDIRSAAKFMKDTPQDFGLHTLGLTELVSLVYNFYIGVRITSLNDTGWLHRGGRFYGGHNAECGQPR